MISRRQRIRSHRDCAAAQSNEYEARAASNCTKSSKTPKFQHQNSMTSRSRGSRAIINAPPYFQPKDVSLTTWYRPSSENISMAITRKREIIMIVNSVDSLSSNFFKAFMKKLKICCRQFVLSVRNTAFNTFNSDQLATTKGNNDVQLQSAKFDLNKNDANIREKTDGSNALCDIGDAALQTCYCWNEEYEHQNRSYNPNGGQLLEPSNMFGLINCENQCFVAFKFDDYPEEVFTNVEKSSRLSSGHKHHDQLATIKEGVTNT